MNIVKENKLAIELGEVLNDMKSLQQYKAFARKFSEEFLREQLLIVLSTPDHKIRKSRAAYFTFLVKQHERYGESDTRN